MAGLGDVDDVDAFDLSTYTLFFDEYALRFQGSGRRIPSTLSCTRIETAQPPAADAAGSGERPCARCSSHTLPLKVDEIVQSITSWEVDRVNHEPVWPAAQLLCWFLVSDQGVKACRDKRVLEVGAGVGLTGLTAAHFASYVCLTDGDEEHLPLLRRNAAEHGARCSLRLEVAGGDMDAEAVDSVYLRHVCCSDKTQATDSNSGEVEASASALCSSCAAPRAATIDVKHLWWGTSHAEAADALPNSPLRRHTFDTIIGSDIVYLREGVEVLVETIAYFLKDNGDSAAYIQNVAHHMTNLDMLRDAAARHSLQVDLVPLDSYVPAHVTKYRSADAYLAKITRTGPPGRQS